MPTRKNSAAAARRRVTDLRNLEAPTDRSAVVAAHKPRSISAETWETIRPAVVEALDHAPVTGEESLRKHVTHLALYFAWAENEGLSLDTGTLTRASVGIYVSRGMRGSSAKSRADRRSRLRAIADRLHPDQAAPPGQVIPRPAVRPPYSPAEMTALRRAAAEQPTLALQRGMCLCLGLGAGAGLSSADFRSLQRCHVEDRGPAGLLVQIPGAQPRRVPVLRWYEDLVRMGLDGLQTEELLLAGREDRRNLAARAVEKAVLHEHCPKVEQSRLRHTWLSHLLGASVPLRVLLTAAGLRSARTLTDLAALLPPPDQSAIDALRTAGEDQR
jgi:site-specific recombinase XerC